MRRATFRFYAELNDFLPKDWRGCAFEFSFELPAAAKDLIEAIGVPHTEVDLLLINNELAPFARVVRDGDRISAYPRFHSLDISRESLVHPVPLAAPGFVLDIHLGRLATYLRMAGFDTLYRNDYTDQDLAAISSSEQRILLTMDRGLLKRGIVTHGYYVRSREPRQQLTEVLRHYDLFGNITPLSRCLECNTRLAPVTKEDIWDRLPPKTRELHAEFFSCTSCRRVFWKGSHYDHMRNFLDRVLAQCTNDTG
jgi:uncharacterized protein with PIN domain